MIAPSTMMPKFIVCWVARAVFSLAESSPHLTLPSSLVTVICFLGGGVVEAPKLLCVAYQRGWIVEAHRATERANGKPETADRGRSCIVRSIMALSVVNKAV